MSRVRPVTLLLSVAVAASAVACRQAPDADAAQLKNIQTSRQQQLAARLAKADRDPTHMTPVAMWIMPPELKEISGLAITADNRLLTHDDETARIHVLDPRTGVILKRFTLGLGMRGDYEGITIGGDDIYLLQSNGIVYQFKEGADGSGVPYNAFDSRLGSECEFEGIVFEPDSLSLLMPCKKASSKKLRGQLVMYRWRPGRTDSTALSLHTIPMSQVIGSNKWKTFHTSDITIDPTSGNYVLLSSEEQGLVEITPMGQVVRSQPLPKRHHQAEGIAITKDGLLIISDEATNEPAAITLYRWHA